LTGRVDSKRLANFFIRGAEACCFCGATESAHAVVTLFDNPMILLNAVVQVQLGTMEDAESKHSWNALGKAECLSVVTHFGLCWTVLKACSKKRLAASKSRVPLKQVSTRLPSLYCSMSLTQGMCIVFLRKNILDSAIRSDPTALLLRFCTCLLRCSLDSSCNSTPTVQPTSSVQIRPDFCQI
jgi:hypothetical protein